MLTKTVYLSQRLVTLCKRVSTFGSGGSETCRKGEIARFGLAIGQGFQEAHRTTIPNFSRGIPFRSTTVEVSVTVLPSRECEMRYYI